MTQNSKSDLPLGRGMFALDSRIEVEAATGSAHWERIHFEVAFELSPACACGLTNFFLGWKLLVSYL